MNSQYVVLPYSLVGQIVMPVIPYLLAGIGLLIIGVIGIRKGRK